MPIKRLPLVAQPSQRESDPTIDATLRNALVEKDSNGMLWCYKRPGLVANTLWPFTGTLLGQIHLTRPIAPYEGSPLLITTAGFYYNGGNYSAGFVGYQGGAQSIDGTYTLVAGTTSAYGLYKAQLRVINSSVIISYTLISSASYPPITANANVAYGVVQLDGTFYIMDTAGAIWGSNVNDPTTWSANNVIQANSSPGAGTALYRQLAYLLAFKEYDIEVFYDAGNATGSPLAPVPSARILYGTKYPFSIAQIDTRMVFVAQTLGGEVFVALIDNLNATRISTPAIDRVLAAYAQANTNVYNISGTCVKVGGHTLYLLCLANSQSYCYDMDAKTWSLWDLPGVSQFPPSTIPSGGESLIPTTAGLYNLSLATAIDAGQSAPFTWSVTTPPFDGGTRYFKYLPRMDILTDNTPARDLQVRWSDDDQRTWSNYRMVNLASSRPSLVNCGRFRRRTFQFQHTGPQPLRLQAVDLQVEEGVL